MKKVSRITTYNRNCCLNNTLASEKFYSERQKKYNFKKPICLPPQFVNKKNEGTLFGIVVCSKIC